MTRHTSTKDHRLRKLFVAFVLVLQGCASCGLHLSADEDDQEEDVFFGLRCDF